MQKFFVRCIKSDNLKFSCPRAMKCQITRETRTRCQYCRYFKCLMLGMYRPGNFSVVDVSVAVDERVHVCPCSPHATFQ